MSAVIKSYWYGGLELVSVFDELSSGQRFSLLLNEERER